MAVHTELLAHELVQAGHDVALTSWRHLGPEGGQVGPFPRTTRPLSRLRPDSWWRSGSRLRGADVVVVAGVVPAAVPALLTLVRAARGGATRPTVVALVHTVLPQRARPGDEQLIRRLLGSVDAVLVHDTEQAEVARRLGARDISVADLPPQLPGGEPLARARRVGPVALLALVGTPTVGPGLAPVLEALAEVPGPRLTVAGGLRGPAADRVRELVARPDLTGRVSLREREVPPEDLARLLAEHDVLVLTGGSGTGSGSALLGHRHGLPVLVADGAILGDQVHDGVDGLVVPPDDRTALVAAVRRLADRDTVDLLRHGIRPVDVSGPWARYVAAIETIAGVRGDDGRGEDGAGLAQRARDTTAAVAASARGIAGLVRPRTDLHSRDLPEWVRPTDVLLVPADAQDAVALARELGLPRARSGVAAWAALGALGAVVRVRDGERRASVIVDGSGAGSVFSRWARAIGYAPVALDEAEHDLAAGSLDVVARLHPDGCTSADVDAVLEQASRLLRRSGLVTLTLPVHTSATRSVRPSSTPSAARDRHRAARGASAVTPADLRAVVARADALSLTLVGDLDRDIGPALSASVGRGAYALVRLTLRRR
jgi:glycosyltransferase involved in cell wall biosynthesis